MVNQLVLAGVWLLATALYASEAQAGHRHHGGWGYGHWGHRHHFHGSFGLHFGDPFWWGYDPFFYRPYVYAPPTVVIPREPPVYIQKPAVTLWYYCPNPAGYYPYVQSCTQQWVAVDPRTVPPSPPR